MRKTLSAIALLLLLAMGVVVNNLRPAPNVKARDAVGKRATISSAENTLGVTYYAMGKGPRIVLSASAGREGSDFNELAKTLASNGFRTLIVEHSGINSDRIASADLAIHAGLLYEALQLDGHFKDEEPFFLVGHAYGNRLVRMGSAAFGLTDNTKPEGVILLAAGGQLPMEAKANKALLNAFDPLRAHKSRMNDVRYAFFAGDNEIPPHWKRGWHTKTAIAQGKAVAESKKDENWHCAGGVPMLIVQPMQDRIAPIENAHALKEKCTQAVEIVEVQNAGHAILPEQPEAVAAAVLDFLAKHHPTDQNKQDTP